MRAGRRADRFSNRCGQETRCFSLDPTAASTARFSSSLMAMVSASTAGRQSAVMSAHGLLRESDPTKPLPKAGDADVPACFRRSPPGPHAPRGRVARGLRHVPDRDCGHDSASAKVDSIDSKYLLSHDKIAVLEPARFGWMGSRERAPVAPDCTGMRNGCLGKSRNRAMSTAVLINGRRFVGAK